MTKQDRLAFIQSFFQTKDKVAVVTALPSEVAEEANLIRNIQSDDSILETEYNYEPSVELISRLNDKDSIIEQRENSAHESSDLLTYSERKQLAKELAEYRSEQSKRFQIVPISFFQNNLARLTA